VRQPEFVRIGSAGSCDCLREPVENISAACNLILIDRLRRRSYLFAWSLSPSITYLIFLFQALKILPFLLQIPRITLTRNVLQGLYFRNYGIGASLTSAVIKTPCESVFSLPRSFNRFLGSSMLKMRLRPWLCPGLCCRDGKRHLLWPITRNP